MKKLLILSLIILFSGCATNHKMTIPELKQNKTETQFEDQFREVLEYCQPRLQGYEAKSVHQARLAFYMKLSGLVAGSVFAPALIAYGATSAWALASTAALAGWAGSSPFAGDALEQSGLSGAAVAETRNNIINKIQQSLVIAVDGSLPIKERRGALLEIQASCIAYEISVPHINWNEN